MTSLACDQTAAWRALQDHLHGAAADLDLRRAFASDANRFDDLSVAAPEVFADLSKNLWTAATRSLLLDLARECDVGGRRDAMLRGERVNRSEDRAVLHTALRALPGDGAYSDAVQAELAQMLAFADSVRAHGSRWTDVVHIGIGGSDLGPRLAAQALRGMAAPRPRVHFVANIDAHEISALLAGLNPASTLFVLASKTFTTAETLANAGVARAWLSAQGVAETAEHFVAVTASPERAAAFGVTRCFAFWDWVGGRFSLWSAIGLPLAIAIGSAGFRDLLAGARAMDEHFAQAPLEGNLPVLLALLDVWYRNFLGCASRAVVPYDHRLRSLPAYLQQLEMESNGKAVDRDGRPLSVASAGVVWGGAGSNAQHAFFQWLHQGSERVPVEFIVMRGADHAHPDMHRQLLANCLAQGRALMLGREAPGSDALSLQRAVPGNRPSTTLLLDSLSPRTLGALLALYEHRVMVAGALWGINSFDQWGVELGKTICHELLPSLESGRTDGLDGSTAALIRRLRA